MIIAAFFDRKAPFFVNYCSKPNKMLKYMAQVDYFSEKNQYLCTNKKINTIKNYFINYGH